MASALPLILLLTSSVVVTLHAPPYHVLSIQRFKHSGSSNKTNWSFGYSIAYDMIQQSLIIGAPQFDNIGAIFSCNISTGHCKGIHVDIFRDTDPKTDAWLGAEVASRSSNVVVCAPRHTEHIDRFRNDDGAIKYGTIGQCFAKTSRENFTQLRVVDQRHRDFSSLETYADSLGWHVNINEIGEIAVGGPALKSGQVVIYSSVAGGPKVINGFKRAKYNFGYDIASGKFVRNTKNIYLAVSSPYGSHGVGEVYIFLGNIYNTDTTITDNSVGTLFGASLCAVNLAEADLDYLLVGAPATSVGELYDTGVVYIYYIVDKGHKPLMYQQIKGKERGGHFGSAIVNLGDLDHDGNQEFAVGAPYENGGRGAVYIYSSNKNNRLQMIQRIQGQDQKRFGLSLAPLADFDQNGCNELAIGAPGSDVVSLLRCMTSVKIVVDAEFPPDLQIQKNLKQFDFNVTINVTLARKPAVVKANLSVSVSLEHNTATLLEAGVRTIHVSYSQAVLIKTYTVNADYFVLRSKVTVLTPVNGDNNSPIYFYISAEQANDPRNSVQFDPSHVILSYDSILNRTLEVPIAKSFVRLSANVSTSIVQQLYIIGSTDKEEVFITIRNTGDTAYAYCVLLSVKRVLVKYAKNCVFIPDKICYSCPINKPLNNGETTVLRDIWLDTKALTSVRKNFTIAFYFHPCYDTRLPDVSSFIGYTVALDSDVDGVVVTGFTDRGDLLNLTTDEVSSGTQLQHVYKITNNGVTNWRKLKGIFTLENLPYVRYSIICNSTRQVIGWNILATTKFTIVHCDTGVPDLRYRNEITVSVAIDIVPANGSLRAAIDANIALIRTNFTLFLNDKNNSVRHASILTKLTVSVLPVWVMALSCMLSLLVVVIVALTLRECGALKRKKREKLEKLQKHVHRQSVIRQSMRQSVSLRDSVIADIQKALETPAHMKLDDVKEETKDQIQEADEEASMSSQQELVSGVQRRGYKKVIM